MGWKDSGDVFVSAVFGVDIISLKGLRVDREVVYGLSVIREVEGILLDDADVDDALMIEIVHGHRFRTISVRRTDVGDKFLCSLGDQGVVEVLNLEGSGITDRGMVCLNRCRGLRKLDVSDTAVSDAAFPFLSGICIEVLRVQNTSVTDAGLAEIDFGCLNTLDVSDNVSIKGSSAWISKISNLESIDVSGSSVDAASIEMIVEKAILKAISVDAVQVGSWVELLGSDRTQKCVLTVKGDEEELVGAHQLIEMYVVDQSRVEIRYLVE
ncbi:hypothetical protein [Rubinisphaera margarita]|uniref:hypothetical protein n=1 Tax=Rubinisphaera margarita TaxID=2909586 RepID=UPI001EE7D052|nr:hypothetical protein [Rubinisphaera margarita]MCG6154363.1 hypothetical protein [Rubinisphaera margarita]